jgi:DNA-binding transcriptional regulator YiaG
LISDRSSEHSSAGASTKKALILDVARELGKPRITPAEIEQIRRKLMAQL